MNKTALILLGILLTAGSYAQVRDTVYLLDCHRSAIETNPLYGQMDLYRQAKELTTSNHTLNWFPSLDLNGRYTWQNEVVEIPIPDVIPGFEKPLMPQYNYKLTLDVQQTLYDGGLSARAKDLEEAVYQVNRQKVEVSLNQLKEKVNAVYFHILVLQQQEKILSLKGNEIDARITSMESLLRNETILASDLYVLRAERLKVEQQLSEIRIGRESALEILAELSSLEITGNTVLVLPEPEADPDEEAVLPEQTLYDMQISSLDASIRLKSRQRFPRAYVFGQFGYGNPALNFFRDEFRGYYIVGAGLQWKIWDWSKTNREKQVLAVQQDLVRTQREAFDKNLDIRLEELRSGILKYEEAVKRDKEILELRIEISRTAASKLENAVITTTEYLTELNAEIEARIMLYIHRIQLEQSRINYLTNKGII
jgi:outer membrane protein TolC